MNLANQGINYAKLSPTITAVALSKIYLALNKNMKIIYRNQKNV